MLSPMLERFSNALPSQCALCHAWPARPLCASCVARYAPACTRCLSCALPVPAGVQRCGACLREPPPLDLCLAAVHYAYPWSPLISRYKFGPNPGWSTALADLMQASPGAAEALQQAQQVLPVPLSQARLRQRGFNQALELARRLAPRKLCAQGLQRLRDTPAQSALPLAARLRNLRGAFVVPSALQSRLAGQRVMLIDDVMTSGATLHSAALALKAAGVAHISALVLARTA